MSVKTYYINSPNAYGKTIQNGTPSPDSPIKLNNLYTEDIAHFWSHYINGDKEYECEVKLPLPNGLPGIPVSSGGNYTDENGQQWICDEIDFARGKYVQNIQKLVFDGSENWRPNLTNGYYYDFALVESNDAAVYEGNSDGQRIMCSHFAVQPKYVNIANRTNGMVILYTSSGKCRLYFTLDGMDMATYCAEQYAAGNPVTVLYQRVFPIETDLIDYSKFEYDVNNVYKPRMNSYYPQVIQAIFEFQAIIDAEYPEFEALEQGNERVISDAYLLTMTEDRVEEWENMLGIRPLEDSSIEDRRETIIARIRGQGKLNTELINIIVNTFTGGTANAWVKNSTLYVEITPPPNNKQYRFENVEQELAKKIPAHLGFEVSRNYYTWEELKNTFTTWGDMTSTIDMWEDVFLFVPFN